MVEWIIFYDDDTTFSSDDGAPGNAPREGVQCIAVADISCGHYVMAEQNWYAWHFEDDCWIAHDDAGMLQYLRRPGIQKIVLAGYCIKRERYAANRQRAMKDPRLPKITAGPPRQPERGSVA